MMYRSNLTRYAACAALCLLTLPLSAVPAKRGQWRTVRTDGGAQVRVEMVGDEYGHFFRAQDGTRYMANATTGLYTAIDDAGWQAACTRWNVRRQQTAAARARRMGRLRTTPTATDGRRRAQLTGEIRHFTGEKRGLVILAEFQDQKFADGHDQALYQRIVDEKGYSEGNFCGSAADYFQAQSGGQMTIHFDAVGPVTLAHNVAYYGGNSDSSGDDLRPEEMVREACRAVDGEVDFSQYDWDGDGEVDQVFIIYAGLGEANGGDEDTIWPHEYELSARGNALTLDGCRVDTYACAAELQPISSSATQIDGIGTLCHEFSHCLGYPDMYDTEYSGNFGMGSWSVMDSGSYAGNGYRPTGYTSYEKMLAGWIDPMELSTEAVATATLSPLSEGGGAYILRNTGHPDEYYLLECRAKTGWDTALPEAGMLVLHVDYDYRCWYYNVVNTTQSSYYGNAHQRLTPLHADGDDDSKYWNATYGYYTKTTEEGDTYPYGSNNRISARSKPAPTWYNTNASGTKALEAAVTDITLHGDGTVTFGYVPGVDEGNAVFYESFDKCSGAGGNDGAFLVNTTAAFTPDLEGWVANEDKAYGGKQCAKFGSASKMGEATTPTFTLMGGATLSFLAAPYGTKSSKLTVKQGDKVIISAKALDAQQWTEVTQRITGDGEQTLTFTFSPDKRFFLDEVRIEADAAATAIRSVAADPATRRHDDRRIYSVQGQYMGTEWDVLPRGVYLRGGEKIVKSK